MTLTGKCPPNYPYCFLFPVSVQRQVFFVILFDYTPRNPPPSRRLSNHLNLVNRGAAPKMGHDSSALTATYSHGARVKMSPPPHKFDRVHVF